MGIDMGWIWGGYGLGLEDEPEYLDWDVLEEFISHTSFQTVPIIKKGKLSELTLLNPKFESEVYKIHSLPKLESNYAEGLVIKPVTNIYIGKSTERLIWKFKNPSFSEIV
jgi:hypothetical protein